MWDIQTLKRLNEEREVKERIERLEEEAEFEAAKEGNRVKD